MSKFQKPENDAELDAVSFYNRHQLGHATSVLVKATGAIPDDIDSWRLPEGAKIIYDGHAFILEGNSDVNMIPGKPYTPFMVLNKFEFKLNIFAAVNFIETRLRGRDVPYIRVGIDYFKKINVTDRFGITRSELKRWKKEEIKQDHGASIIGDIPRYDTFVNAPDNVNYDPEPNGAYNLYARFSHEPAEKDAPWPWTETLLRHVFGEHYELGLRYMQVLYLHPTKALPILVLASKERSTGKTTFLNWMAQIFGANYTVISPQEFTGSFNGSYALSNIIGIEETEDDKRSTVHKIKALSTSKFVPVNQKYIDQYEVPFFGKFIITTNEPTNFLRIDTEEIRFWVHVIPAPKVTNASIEDDLAAEIPAFLRHLKQMPPVDFSRSRMVFTPEELKTEALEEVKAESKSWLHKDINICVDEYFLNHPEESVLELTASDIKEIFFHGNQRVERNYIIKVLSKEMGMTTELKKYSPINDPLVKKTGRVYTFKNESLL